MRTSVAGIEMIKGFEGLRLTSYKCSAGVLTIGYGHTAGVTEGQTITEAEAERLLAADLIAYEKGVSSLVTVFLHQYQFDALVSFAFNLGVNALKSSTLLKLINARADNVHITAEWARWCHAGGKVVLGLQRRRLQEVEIFLKGYKS